MDFDSAQAENEPHGLHNSQSDEDLMNSKKRAIHAEAKLKRGLLYSDCLKMEEDKAFETFARDREWIEKRYDVKINIVVRAQNIGNEQTQIKPGSITHNAHLLADLRKDIAKYSPALFGKLGIKKIVVGGDLVKDERQLAGMMERDGVLYLARAFPFQHELFHQLDFNEGGSEIGTPMFTHEYETAYEKNKPWASLRKGKGRVTGQYNDEEQADYYTYLMNSDQNTDWMREHLMYVDADNIDPNKVEYMKKELLKWSGGQLNEQFWKDLKAGKVDEQYWTSK